MKPVRKNLYESMRDAIVYIRANAHLRPSVKDMAYASGLGLSKFEHEFTQWAGISPKKYLAYLNKEEAKLHLSRKDVLRSALSTGLSSAGRLHGLMVNLEAVSPREYKRGNFKISCGVQMTPFGWAAIGVTKRGVCHLSFLEENNLDSARELVRGNWPEAEIIMDQKSASKIIAKIFQRQKKSSKPIHLQVRGTNFQVKVWEALLKIPRGQVSNYKELARTAGRPKAIRAAGSACGKNSIAYLIPCHRVLTSGGKLGGYRWGRVRKQAILDYEHLNTV